MDNVTFAHDLKKFIGLQSDNLNFKLKIIGRNLEIINCDTDHKFELLFIKNNQVTITVPSEINYITDVIILENVLRCVENSALEVSR